MKILTMLSLIFPLVAGAVEMKTMPIPSCGVDLLVLNSWQPSTEKLKSPLCYEMTSAGKEASVIVMKTTDNSSCGEFLKSMDQSRKKKNLLKPEMQMVSDGGARGEYEITGANLKTAVKQKSLCIKKGKELRVLTATYQKVKGPVLEPIIDQIILSFNFSN
jgi:hypothetical protein